MSAEERKEIPPQCGRTTLGVFFENNLDRFLRFARWIRSRRPAPRGADTLDALQDATAELLRKPLDVNSETEFVRLLQGYVHNAVRAQHRHEQAQKRGQGLAESSLPAEDTLESPHDNLPYQAAARDEHRERLKEVLDRLEPGERELIILRIWHSLSWSEIAAELDLPSVDAARMRYTRVLHHLRDLLPEIGPSTSD